MWPIFITTIEVKVKKSTPQPPSNFNTSVHLYTRLDIIIVRMWMARCGQWEVSAQLWCSTLISVLLFWPRCLGVGCLGLMYLDLVRIPSERSDSKLKRWREHWVLSVREILNDWIIELGRTFQNFEPGNKTQASPQQSQTMKQIESRLEEPS